MRQFQVTVEKKTKSEVELTLSGLLDKDADFPNAVQFEPGSQVHLNMAQLSGVNSSGTRAWILWMEEIVKRCTVTMSSVPPFMLAQASMVVGFFPSGVEIKSFMLSYHCSDLDEAAVHLFKPRVRADGGRFFQIPISVYVKRGTETFMFQLDHSPARILKCLDGKYELYDFERRAFFQTA